jgi:hypothetical protein
MTFRLRHADIPFTARRKLHAKKLEHFVQHLTLDRTPPRSTFNFRGSGVIGAHWRRSQFLDDQARCATSLRSVRRTYQRRRTSPKMSTAAAT